MSEQIAPENASFHNKNIHHAFGLPRVKEITPVEVITAPDNFDSPAPVAELHYATTEDIHDLLVEPKTIVVSGVHTAAQNGYERHSHSQAA